ARGPLPLHARFREFLQREYGDLDSLNTAWNAAFTAFDDPSLQLAAVRPSSGPRGADWQRFIESAIGFTYAVVRDTDEPLYREFLARRYGQPSAINAAYRLNDSSALATFVDVRPKLWDAYLR